MKSTSTLFQLALILNIYLIRCDEMTEDAQTLTDETSDPSGEWWEDAVLSKEDYNELLGVVSAALETDPDVVHMRLIQESDGSDPSTLLLQLRDELQLHSETEGKDYDIIDDSEAAETDETHDSHGDDADVVEDLDAQELEAGETVEESVFCENSAGAEETKSEAEGESSILDKGTSTEPDGASESSSSGESQELADSSKRKSKFQENWELYRQEITDQVKSDLMKVRDMVYLVVPPWLRFLLVQTFKKMWLVVQEVTRVGTRLLRTAIAKAQLGEKALSCYRIVQRWLRGFIIRRYDGIERQRS